ncbi:MAG: hypothetical protein WDA16_07295 [Candidatus Thermoplasmatota archaeon]
MVRPLRKAPPQQAPNATDPAWTANDDGQTILEEIRHDVEEPLLMRIAELTRVLDETQSSLSKLHSEHEKLKEEHASVTQAHAHDQDQSKRLDLPPKPRAQPRKANAVGDTPARKPRAKKAQTPEGSAPNAQGLASASPAP